MPQYLEIIYLDSSVIIAWLQNEIRPNQEMEGVEYCIERIKNNEIKAITSVTTVTEILPSKFPPGRYDLFERTIRRRKNFEFMGKDIRISALTQEIRDYYKTLNMNITTPDADHLATAIQYNVDALYTLDADDLLPLNGNVAGHNLRICKPPLPRQRRLPF
jgi:predicted nucleic acid-binding protein